MNCTRCNKELDTELAAKFEIMKEMFGVVGPDGKRRDWECDGCNSRFIKQCRRLWWRLTDKSCWEWDVKRWVKEKLGIVECSDEDSPTDY